MNDLEDRVRDCLRAQSARAQIVDLTSAARLRSRQLGRRRRALAIGGALPVAAGAAAALGTAIALTISSAPPALAAVTSALTRTLKQSYHISEQDGGYYIRNGQITDRWHGTCTEKADPVRHLEASSCSNGAASREVGSYTYIYFTDPLDHTPGRRGKHWERIPTACETDPALSRLAINGFTTATPQQMLSEIKNADNKVIVVGPASGPGWTGTRYAFHRKPRARGGDQLQLNGTVDVDQQGRARALVLTIRTVGATYVYVMTQALTFSDFGARVTVTPPPADQTFTWPWPC